MWRHSVPTWRHEVTELTIDILACRCARKMIVFLFLWYFESSSSNMLLIFHLCNAMTSCQDVTKPDLPISACRCARKLILFCFHGFLSHWVQKCYWFFICVMLLRHGVMSGRHLTWFPSQLVDVLENWFFFCFHGF